MKIQMQKSIAASFAVAFLLVVTFSQVMAATTIGTNISTDGTLAVTGATTLSSTLGVTGNTTLTGDLAINGGDLTTTNTTFNLLNTTATTINVAGGAGAGTLIIGAGTTSLGGALAVTGNTALTGDLSVNGGDLVTSAATFNLVNGTATTLRIGGGASTALVIGNDSGTTTFNGFVGFDDGALTIPSITFNDDTNTGIYSAAADEFDVSVGGTNRLIIAGATQSLTLTGTTTLAGSTTVSTGPLTIPVGTVGAPSLIFSGDSNTGLFTPGADQLTLVVGGGNLATLGSSTKLFTINGTTTINGSSTINANITFPTTLEIGSYGAISQVERIEFYESPNSGYSPVRFISNGDNSNLNYRYSSTTTGGITWYDGDVTVQGSIRADGDGTNPTFGIADKDSQFAIGIRHDDYAFINVNNTEVLRATSGLDIGIGTGTPAAKLEVEVDNAENVTALLLDMDDTTNNPTVLNIQNAGSGLSLLVDQGNARFDGRILGSQGADIASANDLTLGGDGNSFEITGNTQINALTTTNWQNGSVVTLLFTSNPTVKHNTAGGAGTAVFLLSGSADFGATAGDTLTLILSEIGGTQAWREIARTAI